MAEALDTLWTLILAAGAWLLALALAATAAVYAVGILTVLACRAVRRALRGAWRAVSRPQTAPGDSRDATPAPEASSARTADRVPVWARTRKDTA